MRSRILVDYTHTHKTSILDLYYKHESDVIKTPSFTKTSCKRQVSGSDAESRWSSFFSAHLRSSASFFHSSDSGPWSPRSQKVKHNIQTWVESLFLWLVNVQNINYIKPLQRKLTSFPQKVVATTQYAIVHHQYFLYMRFTQASVKTLI